MTDWWEAGGATGCIQALQAKGAASYAASLTDLSGNGNDASEGVAPDWDSTNGWKFNGSDDYLITGIVPGENYTMIISLDSSSTNTDAICGKYEETVGEEDLNFRIMYAYNPIEERIEITFYHGDGVYLEIDTVVGVYALAGRGCYINGSSVGTITSDWYGNGDSQDIYIGAYNSDGSPSSYIDLYVQAFAIYDNTLSADEVAAVSTAMENMSNRPSGTIRLKLNERQFASGTLWEY